MAAGVQEFNRTESDRLNEIKGHLEIALLEKHFLREYQWGPGGGVQHGRRLAEAQLAHNSCHWIRGGDSCSPMWTSAHGLLPTESDLASAALHGDDVILLWGKGQCPREGMKCSLGNVIVLVRLLRCYCFQQLTQNSSERFEGAEMLSLFCSV